MNLSTYQFDHSAPGTGQKLWNSCMNRTYLTE